MNLFVIRKKFDRLTAPLVSRLARLPLSANAWTMIAWVWGVLASIPFVLGWYHVGIILFALRGLIDHVDGYVARSRGETSVLGAVLDDMGDRYVIATFLLIACAHLAPQYPHLPYVGAFAVAGTLCNAFVKPCVYVVTRDTVVENGKVTHPMDLVGLFGSAEFLIYFGIPTLIGALVNRMWFLVIGTWLTAILSHVSLVQRLVFVARHYGLKQSAAAAGAAPVSDTTSARAADQG